MYKGPYKLRAVGYQNDDYFVRFHNYCWNVKCPRPGASVDFLKLTLQLMNSTMEIVPIDSDVDATIKMIANGTADISLEDLRMTTARLDMVDFTYPTNFIHFGYLLREVPELEVEDYILASFDLSVVVLLVTFGITVGLLAYFYSRLILRTKQSCFQWIFRGCVSLLRQFQFYINGPTSALVLLGCWIFCCMVAISFYEAKLKSFLTLSHARGTIFRDLNGVLDAVENKEWIMVIQERGYDPAEYANAEQLKRLKNIPKDRILRVGPNDDYLTIVSQEKHVGFGAYTNDMEKYPIVNIDFRIKLLFVRDEVIAPEYMAFAIRKNSSDLRERLNRALAESTLGYNNIRGRYYGPFLEYTNHRYQPTRNLTLTHFTVLFKFWIIFVVIAVILLVFENVYARVKCKYLHYKLYINPNNHFIRTNLIILPIRRSSSPINELYGRFHITN